jgi:hypothetical protein
MTVNLGNARGDSLEWPQRTACSAWMHWRKATMRIAYVLQTYRLLDQVGRLIDTLQRGCPDDLIVVVHSGSRDELAALARRQRIDCVLKAAPARGRFGLVDSYMSALRWLQRQGKPYDWVVLLSGQDYPIRPLSAFRETLTRSPVDGYFYFFDPLDPRAAACGRMAWPANEAQDRYFYRYGSLMDDISVAGRIALKLPKMALALTQRYRINTSFGLAVGRRAKAMPFCDRLRLYAGSYWHIIRRECAETLVRFADENPDVVDYFRHVVLPDEAFIQTVLVNTKTFRLSPDDLRYYDFSHSRHGNSKTLGPTDLAAAFASQCFFARKFDTAAHPEILDDLDRRVFAQ